jgi:glycosyltransferase involved in cell wall biosynthesis
MAHSSSNNKRLKIAYLCETDPKHAWAHSGGNTRIFNVLQEHVGDLTFIGQSWGWLDFLRLFIQKMPEKINLRLRFRVHLLLSRFIARYTVKQLKKQHYDVLFCSYSFFCLANLKTPYPILTVFTSDATFTGYKNSEVGAAFDSMFSLSRKFDTYIKKMEDRVYGATDLMLWPSDWTKSSSDRLYALSDAQSKLVYWGANIEKPPIEDLSLDTAVSGQIRLLLVGRDWYHKGGPLVFSVLEALLAKNIDASLTVIGCVPPDEHRNDRVTVYPQLDKTKQDELQTFKQAFKDAHFFVMPSYEAYGFAFCEAAAYGLPALCLNVGGIPVVEGVSGHALPKASTANDFVALLERYLADEAAYKALRQSTRKFYEENLNWEAWAGHTKKLIEAKLQEKSE